MFAYVIMRETRYATDSKIVFDKRKNLIEDQDAVDEIGHEFWPGDPDFTISDIENPTWYRAEVLPCDTVYPKIKIYQDEDKTTWMWETVWSTYDYKDNIVEGIYECGNNLDYGVVVREAFASYASMVVMEAEENEETK